MRLAFQPHSELARFCSVGRSAGAWRLPRLGLMADGDGAPPRGSGRGQVIGGDAVENPALWRWAVEQRRGAGVAGDRQRDLVVVAGDERGDLGLPGTDQPPDRGSDTADADLGGALAVDQAPGPAEALELARDEAREGEAEDLIDVLARIGGVVLLTENPHCRGGS